jgi:type I restriction enzyme S subunit
MSKWKDTRLGDIIILNYGKALKEADRIPGHIPVYSSAGLTGYHNIPLVNSKGLIIGRKGTIGKVYKSLVPFCCIDTAYYILPNEVNYDFDFFYFLLQTLGLEDLNEDSAVPGLNRETAYNQPILLPPLPEQKAIASILRSLDDKIDLLHRQNATLEKLAETLFRQWFVQEAKEDWKEKKLGELLTITSSKRIFYSEYVSAGIPFYRSKEIIELRNTGSTASELYISNDRFEEIDSKFGSPETGDILMTSVGTLGVAYRVRPDDRFYFKDGNLTWFKDFKEIPSSIIYLWLISKIGQEELAAITIGSTQQALTIEGLKSISFKIPEKATIDRCSKEFDIIISKIESNQTQIRTLTTMRDTLLPKLMSGEVRVSAD